ncbi:MAG TPA: sugar transferase [Thermoguttaceae bacterium]|mgnify:FL=1|nr:sugar transferase [Thermoguttaceae bacterium]HPP53583.1 sugar transferase [Thermoguttaceae bacterium]
MAFFWRKYEPEYHIPPTPSPAPGEAAERYFRWVGWLNRIGAGILLVPAIPIIGVLVFLVRLTSYGPGIYRQKRVGRNGRVFTLYKIRTMIHNAEALTGPVWTAPNDPRITKFGKLLRAVHLDELPQLFNVLMGHMSLVGPRPERPEFTEYLAQEVPGYMRRYVVPPGITGLAQINLPPDTDVDNVRKKLLLDLEYIRTANWKLDLKILLCTAVRLFGFPGMWLARKLGLYREPAALESAMETAKPEAKPPASGAPTTFPAELLPKLVTLSTGGNGARKAHLPQTTAPLS